MGSEMCIRDSSALEAMSCEVPVIGTNVGGLPELIKHGETGYITEVGDVDKMALHAVDLLTDDTLRKQFHTRRQTLWRFSCDFQIVVYKSDRTATAG